MRVFSSIDSKKLLSKLAGTCKCDKKHAIIASEKQDTKDEAIDCAKTYWMMGWTWDEIEVILEDSEYPSKIVTEALKEAKEYAKEILNKGPFSELKAGQLVKLESGAFGTLEALYQDHASINVNGIGKTKVPLEQLNKVACEKLSRAQDLRNQASNMLQSAHHESFSVTASASSRTSVPLQLLHQITAVETHATKLMTRLNTFSERLRVEAKDKIKLSAKNKELVQLCGAIVSQEKENVSEITELIGNELSEKIAKLYEIDKDKTEIQSAMDALEVIISGTLEHLVDASDIVKIAEKEFGNEHWSATSLKNTNENWDKTREYYEGFGENVRAKLLDAQDSIVGFIEKANKEDIANKVAASLNTRV